MRKVAGLCAIVFILLAAVVASAQSLPGFGLPFFGSYRFGCDGPKAFLNSDFYIGYGDGRPTSIDIELTGTGILGGLGFPRRFEFQNRGLWLGLSEELWLFDRCGVMLSGWWMVPNSGVTYETIAPPAAISTRQWTNTNKWWYLDGALAINLGGCGTLLGGFRYDYNTATFRDPFNIVNLNPLATNLQADLITSNLLPYIGFQTALRGANSSVTARIIGFPTVAGWLKFSETTVDFVDLSIQGRPQGSQTYSSGYFLETLLEASYRAPGGLDIGGFFKWTGLQGRGSFNATGALAGLEALGTNAGVNFNVYRQNWVIGGKFGLAF